MKLPGLKHIHIVIAVSIPSPYLSQLTQIPSAAGKEEGVVNWVRAWVESTPGLLLQSDAHGNLTIRHEREPQAGRPIYFTAHMDHPAFVVERIVAPSVVELSFRGGVMDEYFLDADIQLHCAGGPVGARLNGAVEGSSSGVFKHYIAELKSPAKPQLGDIGVWDVGPAYVSEGNWHTLACDDLAALAAAIEAFESLPFDSLLAPVRLLLTRAEEIGFVGAIGACRDRTMPMDARVIALENSRSFAESPIGGGPIVRVGDRLSVFTPGLTDAVAKVAENIAGGPSTVMANQKLSQGPSWKWQRKLMAGGACEASVYCAYGYQATCICLPLGNYHNMANLSEVQAGTFSGTPRAAHEYISVSDYNGLVTLLAGCATGLPDSASTPIPRFEKLWTERKFVL